MDTIEILARHLAAHRLERDRKIADDHECPSILKREAYLPQTRKEAEVACRCWLQPDERD